MLITLLKNYFKFFLKVEKIIDPLFDIKDLAVFDNNPTACKITDTEKLNALARDNAQLIFNEIYDRKKFERFGELFRSLRICFNFKFPSN